MQEALLSIRDGSYKQGPKILYLKNGNVCEIEKTETLFKMVILKD